MSIATVTNLSAPIAWTAMDEARATRGLIDALADERCRSEAGRRAFLVSLRSKYAATATNPHVSQFTRDVAALVLHALPEPVKRGA